MSESQNGVREHNLNTLAAIMTELDQKRAEFRAIYDRAQPITIDTLKRLPKGAVVINNYRPWQLLMWVFRRVDENGYPILAPRAYDGSYGHAERFYSPETLEWRLVNEADLQQWESDYEFTQSITY